MSPRYQLDLLGGCRLVDLQTRAEVVFRSRKARCLIGLVALWPGARMSREKVASFLWDPAPDELARTSLRQCLKEIRDCLGDGADLVLDSQRLDIGIFLDNITIDVGALVNGLGAAKADRHAALALAAMWKGELFGEMIPSAPIFEAWVQVERTRFRSILSGLLTDHLQYMSAANDFASPDMADELVRIEPSHELAYQFLMRYHAARGDQAGALRQYARLTKVLEDELDSEPSQESIDLLVAIKRGDSFAKPQTPVEMVASAAPKTEALGVPRIAIRPPLTRFGDDSKDYMADGFSGLLKVCLSRFRCWIVLSWPSQGFDSKIKIDYAALGAAIGADYVVDTVLDWRQANGQLFVSLIDCRDGSQIWTDIYAVAESELQSMSNTVAGRISSKLASRINYMSSLRFARGTPGDAAAYDLWLRGHQLSRSWSRKDDELAKDLFLNAIEKDPGLACAYSSLAGTLMTQCMIRPGYAGVEADLNAGFDFAQKAIALDSFDSHNHLSMAWSWLMKGSKGRADSHFRLAVDLNAYDTETLISSAMGLAFIGDVSTAKKWAEDALALNPLHPEYFQAYWATILYLLQDYNGTIECFDRCTEFLPDTWAWVAASHAMNDNENEAIEAFSRFLSFIQKNWEGPDPPSWADTLAWLHRSIPIVWTQGRTAFDKGLEKARSLHSNRYAPTIATSKMTESDKRPR
jgi:DNA-binding SARP family transcriptional activator